MFDTRPKITFRVSNNQRKNLAIILAGADNASLQEVYEKLTQILIKGGVKGVRELLG